MIISEDYSDTSFPDLTYSSYTSLDTIICKTATPPTLYDTFKDGQYVSMTVIVPTSSLSEYQSADVWKKFWNLKGGAENYTTGISTVTADETEKASVVYDLQGRKLEKPQRGLNIINGKKVFVK